MQSLDYGYSLNTKDRRSQGQGLKKEDASDGCFETLEKPERTDQRPESKGKGDINRGRGALERKHVERKDGCLRLRWLSQSEIICL